MIYLAPELAQSPTAKVPFTRRRLVHYAVGMMASGGVALAACQRAGAPAQAGPPKPAKLSGKIRFYTRGGEVETRGQAEILIPTFKEVAPEVEVEHLIFAAGTAGETYTTKLYTMWAAGDPPDVWGFGQNYMAFWARGMLEDLTPYIVRDKYDLNQFHKGLPEIFRINGKYYGIPQLTTFGTLLFYNKDLFAKEGLKPPPVDWDDTSWTFDVLLEYARKLTKNPGTPEAIYGLAFNPQLPTMLGWLWGGDCFLPEHYTTGVAPRTQIESQPSLEGHQWAQDIRWKHQVSPRPGVDPTQGIGFIQGRYAMDINGGWNFWGYTVIKDFRWGAAAIPIKVTNKNVNYNDFWEMASQSRNKEAAWAFIKHVASAEIQRKYSELTGTPPTQKAAMDVWYRRYEGIMTRDELEKVTQGAIEPKRSQESPDHLFIDWSIKIAPTYSQEIWGPISRNEGNARDIIARGKPAYDAVVNEIYNEWKDKLPK